MERRKATEALLTLVATLGELAATVTGLDGPELRAVYPEKLCKALGTFTRHLRATLRHHRVPCLLQAALTATPGVTCGQVRAALRAWRKSILGLLMSWERLRDEATKVCDTWESSATTQGTAGEELAEDKVTTATRRGQGTQLVLGLLGRLVTACPKATEPLLALRDQLKDMELALEGTQEVSPDVTTAQLLWVPEQIMDHLLLTLGHIHQLTWSPHGGPGGPEGSEDTPGPRCAGSSGTGTPEQPEGTWGAAGAGAGSPRQLLPPGTRRELLIPRGTRISGGFCSECVLLEVTGISPQTQNFLIIGKDSKETLGFSVLPTVRVANSNKISMIAALPHRAPLVVEADTAVAVAIALPGDINQAAGDEETPGESFTPGPALCWALPVMEEPPELRCRLTHEGETVEISGLLDTGAAITVISPDDWPRHWRLGTSRCVLSGVGGTAGCVQSRSQVVITGPRGHRAATRVFVGEEKLLTVWGRDVLHQWGAKIQLQL